jgi:hypothetical protein
VKNTAARTAAVICGALVAAALAVAPVHATDTATPSQMHEQGNTGMQRMHELHMQGNPGMQRMHELHMQGNPGMQRMHELHMQGNPGMQRMHELHVASGHCSGHTTADH